MDFSNGTREETLVIRCCRYYIRYIFTIFFSSSFFSLSPFECLTKEGIDSPFSMANF